MDGEWHLVAARYDGSQVTLYADGIEIGRSPVTGALDTSGDEPAYIGSNAGSSEFLSGGIDSLAALRRLKDNYAPSHPAYPRDALLVHGFDIGGASGGSVLDCLASSNTGDGISVPGNASVAGAPARRGMGTAVALHARGW